MNIQHLNNHQNSLSQNTTMFKSRTNTNTNKKIIEHTVPYTINDGTICFMIGFNSSLDEYYSIINTCKCIKFANNNTADCLVDIGVVLFNTGFEIPNNITSIEFNKSFNCPIVLTPNLTHVVFGSHFSRSVVLSRKLKHIVFKRIVEYYENIILPKSTEYLNLSIFHTKQCELTKKLIVLHMSVGGCGFNPHFTQKFILNKALCKLLVTIDGSQQIVLSKNLIVVTLEFSKKNSNIHFDLPKNIKKIVLLRFLFKKPLILTPNLTYLLFSTIESSKTFIIEKPINEVFLDANNYKAINNLPNGTKSMGLFSYPDSQTVNNLPSDIQTIYIGNLGLMSGVKVPKHIMIKKPEFYDDVSIIRNIR